MELTAKMAVGNAMSVVYGAMLRRYVNVFVVTNYTDR